MHKYGGLIVHRSRDEYGDLEVVQNDHARSLHFGTPAKQSSMLLTEPDRLALSYTRAMTCALLFTDAPPQRTLLIGLGGGSLAKFLLHRFPRCRIDVVELRESVLKLARAYFMLPDDPRLSVVIGDAYPFATAADPGRYAGYDLILVDAFVSDGIAPQICGGTFFDALAARLAPTGCLAMNLWSGDYVTVEDLLDAIAAAFGNRPLQLPVSGKDNIIALVGRGQPLRRQLRRLGERARELERRLDVEYPAFLRRLRKANGWLF